MSTSLRFTSADLELLPDIDNVRYEIIDGDLHVSKATNWHHQYACGEIFVALRAWSLSIGAGLAIFAPGVIFAPDDDVVPDLVWISHERRLAATDEAGHFRTAPELVVEVLSPGSRNIKRDRELKLRLYSRQGVREYWIVDWRARNVQVYHRENLELRLATTLEGDDLLTSPILLGFSCPISSFWEPSA